VALAATAWSGTPLSADGVPTVAYDPVAGTLAIEADGVSLDAVLQAVGRAADMEIVTYGQNDALVSIELADLPIRAALARLLDEHSYTLKQDPVSGRPVKLWLMTPTDPAELESARRAAQEKARLSAAPQQKTPPEPIESEIARDLREELRALSDGGSEEEILQELGLDEQEREQLLRALDQMEAGASLEQIERELGRALK
jgi:hypothetical protein